MTSGMPSIDFFFGLDDESQDAGDTQYSEQLIRMQYINTIPYHPEVRKNEVYTFLLHYSHYVLS